MAGNAAEGPGPDRRQLLVWYERGRDRRRDDRGAHRGGRELRGDEGPAGGCGGGRSAGEGAEGDRVQGLAGGRSSRFAVGSSQLAVGSCKSAVGSRQSAVRSWQT